MTKSGTGQGQSASELISQRIAELGDWRGETLSRMRKLIWEADPEVVEEWKWMGTPIFSHDGIVCTGESYKQVVKLTFAKGASLKDPARLFNSSLDGNVRRAIDIREGEVVDESAFKALVLQAVQLNRSAKSKPAKQASAKPAASKATKPASAKATASNATKRASAKPAASKATKRASASKPAKPASAKATASKPAKTAARKASKSPPVASKRAKS
jgi:hypothetical protein